MPPVTHNDFLDYSTQVISEAQVTEFQLRNAASRAYYALYHKAAQTLEMQGVPIVRTENGGSHEALISTMSRLGEKGRSIATNMDRLKKFRHQCDYNLDQSVTKKRVELHVAEVSRLVDMINRLLSSD